ncbi:hypothetical protein L9F63_014998, partial [Diploptera punctata]
LYQKVVRFTLLRTLNAWDVATPSPSVHTASSHPVIVGKKPHLGIFARNDTDRIQNYYSFIKFLSVCNNCLKLTDHVFTARFHYFYENCFDELKEIYSTRFIETYRFGNESTYVNVSIILQVDNYTIFYDAKCWRSKEVLSPLTLMMLKYHIFSSVRETLRHASRYLYLCPLVVMVATLATADS